MNRPWMPLYVGDYLGDTGHLTTAQHGAYLLLMMHYWRKGELPDDDRQLSKITKLPLRTWCEYRPTLQEFLLPGLEAQADRRRTSEDAASFAKARDRRTKGRHRLGARTHEAGKRVALRARPAASNCRAAVGRGSGKRRPLTPRLTPDSSSGGHGARRFRTASGKARHRRQSRSGRLCRQANKLASRHERRFNPVSARE